MNNQQLITALDKFGGQLGQELSKKTLPVRLMIAKNEFIYKLQEKYKIYEATLKELCEKQGIDPADAGKCKDPQFLQSLVALLGAEVDLEWTPIAEGLLEQCGEGKYDTLTGEELDLLYLMI